MNEIDNRDDAPDRNSDRSWTDERATLGDRIAAAREAMGIGQEQLARRLGVRTATVVAWEDDRSEPRANRMQMLAGVVNAPLVWLMTGVGEGPGAATPAGALIAELAELRAEQQRLAERFARLESRLRAALAA